MSTLGVELDQTWTEVVATTSSDFFVQNVQAAQVQFTFQASLPAESVAYHVLEHHVGLNRGVFTGKLYARSVGTSSGAKVILPVTQG